MADPKKDEINIPEPKLIRRLEGRTSALTHLALSSDEGLLVGAGADSQVHIWDVTTGALIRRLDLKTPADIRAVMSKDSVAWSKDAKMVFMTNPFGAFELWQAARTFWGKPIDARWASKCITNPTANGTDSWSKNILKFETVAVSAKGLIAAGQQRYISIYRLDDNGKPRFLHKTKCESGTQTLAFSPSGNKLAVSTNTAHQVFFASEAGLTPIGPACNPGGGTIEKMAWLTEDILVSGSSSGIIGVHSNTANERYEVRSVDSLRTICLVDDKTIIVSVITNKNQELRFLKLPTLETLRVIKGFRDTRSILLFGNAQYMIVSDSHTQDATGWMQFAPAIYDFGAPNLGRAPIPLIPDIDA